MPALVAMRFNPDMKAKYKAMRTAGKPPKRHNCHHAKTHPTRKHTHQAKQKMETKISLIKTDTLVKGSETLCASLICESVSAYVEFTPQKIFREVFICDTSTPQKEQCGVVVAVEYHSAIGTAAWTDLRRSLIDDAVSGIRGTPRMKPVGSKAYWYDHFRLGNKTIDRYIGEDTPYLRAQLDRHLEIANARKQSDRERARLMRVLRAEGYLFADVGSGQIVSAMANAGVFRLGGTIVGTQAFRCYEGELGIRIGFDQSAATDDIDIASFERLSLALADTVEPPLVDVFTELQFDPLPALESGKTWRWRQTNRQTLIEFLTPSFEENEGVRDLPALGVNAQSLHFLNYLISDPIRVPFLYRSGVLVQIPRPERYAIHKLIVADRRQGGLDALKAHKDRAQAAFLIEALAEARPDDIAEAYRLANDTGPAWRKRISASLQYLPAVAKLLKELP